MPPLSRFKSRRWRNGAALRALRLEAGQDGRLEWQMMTGSTGRTLVWPWWGPCGDRRAHNRGYRLSLLRLGDNGIARLPPRFALRRWRLWSSQPPCRSS